MDKSAFEPRDCPIYFRNGSKYIIFILDAWVHVHLTMLAWFPISISNELNNDGAISK